LWPCKNITSLQMGRTVSRNGFTFIELIMVMSIIGIISIIAVPTFVNLQNEAKQKSELATVGAVRSGLYNYYIQSQMIKRSPLYPALLDSATNGAVSSLNPFFTNVLSISALRDWQKSGLAYAGPTSTVYTYNPGTGTFESDVSFLYGWSMNEGTGGTIGDSGYLGNIQGNTQWVDGKVGSALNFDTGTDGLGGYVQVPDSSALELTTAGTVESWIYADSLIPNQGAGIVHKGDAADFSDEAYSLQFWTGNTIALLVDSSPGSYQLIQSTVNLVPGQWYHVVGTWDSSGMRIYINGQLNNSNTVSVVAQKNSGALNIGAQLSSSYNSSLQNLGFNGIIDEVQVYDKALSADEISAYYSSTK
jgi:prepilin-type N-terminal cleavage/methylation domain-containing protein